MSDSIVPEVAESIRVRKDVLNLTSKEKDDLIYAWIALQDVHKGIDGVDPFYPIAGLHGQPFRGPGYGNSAWWGGYCHHGNVLFPTWHRAYLLYLEDAIRKVSGQANFALPYWNEMRDEDSGGKLRVVPSIFTDQKYKFTTGSKQGKTVDNPLYSYTLAQGFTDQLQRPGEDLSKPKGYKTVRHPYSGLVGPKQKTKTDVHNAAVDALGEQKRTEYLNDVVGRWLNDHKGPERPGVPGVNRVVPGLRTKFKLCLNVEEYTYFSNTTSATKFNDNTGKNPLVVSLEAPHNGLHLAVGGYDTPFALPISGANGDMGENDTASFDPIFYFHHCFIDKVFWVWQQKGRKITIMERYPGTNTVDLQGPTPDVPAGGWLDINTPLHPFKFGNEDATSKNMENTLALPGGRRYKYDSNQIADQQPTLGEEPSPFIRVSGVNRAAIPGSFVISAWAKAPNSTEAILAGFEPVLSRWHVTGCANCNTHLNVTAHMPLIGWPDGADKLNYEVRVDSGDGTGAGVYSGEAVLFTIGGLA